MILELTYFEIMKLIVGCALAGIPVGALAFTESSKALRKLAVPFCNCVCNRHNKDMSTL